MKWMKGRKQTDEKEKKEKEKKEQNRLLVSENRQDIHHHRHGVEPSFLEFFL